MKNKKIVLDTSTLVSALLFKNSIPDRALRKARKNYQIIVSEETQKELITVIVRPKFDRYFSLDQRLEMVTNFLSETRLITDIQAVENECRDPKDVPFLELAYTAQARLIISSDSDLLDLHPFHEILIMKPATFMDFETDL